MDLLADFLHFGTSDFFVKIVGLKSVFFFRSGVESFGATI